MSSNRCTFLLGSLFLDSLVGVDPAGDALLVRVLQAEIVRLHDVQLAEDDLEQLAAQRPALKQSDGWESMLEPVCVAMTTP